MEWLSQNWGYLLLLLGVIVFMRFGGIGCSIGHRGARTSPEDEHGRPPEASRSGPADAQGATPDAPSSGMGNKHPHRHHGGGGC